MTSDEGYEQQFALNHLAGFLLARELMPQLIKAGGRVLFTASQSHKHTRMRWNDLMLQRGYHPLFAYKQSKLCNLLTALALNGRYGGDGVRAYCVDPGLVDTGIGCKRTGWLVNFVWSARRRYGRAPELAAATYAYLLNCMEPSAGTVFPRRAGRKVTAGRSMRRTAERLYQISLKLSGAKEGVGAAVNVLITGAAGGLGRAFAVECAKRGFGLFLTDINAAGLESIRVRA